LLVDDRSDKKIGKKMPGEKDDTNPYTSSRRSPQSLDRSVNSWAKKNEAHRMAIRP